MATFVGAPPTSHKLYLQRSLLQELSVINAGRMLAFCLVYIVLQLTLVFQSGLRFSPTPLGMLSWIFNPMLPHYVVWATFEIVALCLAAGFAVLFFLVRKGVIKSSKTKSILVHLCLILLTCLQANFSFLEYLTGSNFVACSLYLFMLGALPILPRAQRVCYLSSYVLLSAFALYIWAWAWLANTPPPIPAQTLLEAPTHVDLLVEFLFPIALEYWYLIFGALLLGFCASWLNFGMAKKNILLRLELEEKEAWAEALVEQRYEGTCTHPPSTHHQVQTH